MGHLLHNGHYWTILFKLLSRTHVPIKRAHTEKDCGIDASNLSTILKHLKRISQPIDRRNHKRAQNVYMFSSMNYPEKCGSQRFQRLKRDVLFERLLCAIFTVHKNIHTLFNLFPPLPLPVTIYLSFTDTIQCFRSVEIGWLVI